MKIVPLDEIDALPVNDEARAKALKEFLDERVRRERVLDVLMAEFKAVEQNDVVVDRVILSPTEYATLRTVARDTLDIETNAQVIRTGVLAHLWTARVFVRKDYKGMRVLGENPFPLEGVLGVFDEKELP